MTTSKDVLEPYRGSSKEWKIPLNSIMDDILSGGVEAGVITQVYGPSGAGKTNFCIITTVNAVRINKKVVFIDTEGSHSFDRLMQVAGKDYDRVLKSLYFYEAHTFEEQEFIIENLDSILDESFGLIVVDSAVALYRVIRNDDSIHDLNRRLSRQMAKLIELAGRYNLTVVITNQVYSSPGNSENEPVAGDILKYWSKAIVELKKKGKKREAVLRRHRSLPEDIKVKFKITKDGIEGV